MAVQATAGTFPAGHYYVGDLCYNKSIDWDEFCDMTIKGHECLSGVFTLKDGRDLASYSTMYGDGVYRDNLGNEYWVDAGLIGIIGCEEGTQIRGGHVFYFPRPFKVFCPKDGVMAFGNIVINTCDEEENDDE